MATVIYVQAFLTSVFCVAVALGIWTFIDWLAGRGR